jgi:hypothetical protein
MARTTWWSSTGTAFVYEPSGQRTSDILEIANAQLLELRYYDDALDQPARVNQRLKRERRRLRSIFGAPTPRCPGRCWSRFWR